MRYINEIIAKNGPGAQIRISAIVAQVTSQSIMKVSPNMIGCIAKYVTEQGSGIYIYEWLEYLQRHVNPKETTVSATWLEELVTHIQKRFVIFRANLSELQFNRSTVMAQIRPLPDIGRFTSVADLASLAKNVPRLELCETFMRENRLQFQQVLAKLTDDTMAREYLRALEHNVCRMAIGKPLESDKFSPGVVGAVSKEKLDTMRVAWVRWLQSSSEHLNGLAAKCHFAIIDEAAAADEVIQPVYDVLIVLTILC